MRSLLSLPIMYMMVTIATPEIHDHETHIINQRVAIDITDDKGVSLGQLQVEKGDHAVKKTKEFISKYELSFDYGLNMLNALCEREDFPCKTLVNLPINNEYGQTVVNVVIRDGESPSAVVAGYCASLGWGIEQCDMIMSHVCKQTTCNYIANMPVRVGPNADVIAGQLQVLEGEDAVNGVVRFCAAKASQMTKAECKFLIKHVCSLERADCEILTNTTVTIHLQGPRYPVTNVGDVTVFRGEDPIDAVQAFCHRKQYSAEVCAFAKHQVCRDMQEVNQECVDRPIVSLPIADEQNIGRGNLEIFVGQEPIDVINAFVQSRGLPKTYRQFLYRMLCENNGGGNHGRDLICVRSDPALEYEFILGLGPGNCETDILGYVSEQIDSWENRRWAGKEYYEYLDVPVDADLGMIELAFRRQMRELGSEALHETRRKKLQEAYDVLADPKKKAYYDQPCKEFPGLSGMCVKHLPGGGMNIICGGSKI